jgi:hypothetical protein
MLAAWKLNEKDWIPKLRQIAGWLYTAAAAPLADAGVRSRSWRIVVGDRACQRNGLPWHFWRLKNHSAASRVSKGSVGFESDLGAEAAGYQAGRRVR